MNCISKITLISLSLVFVQEVQALKMDLGAGAGLEYSSNIQRVAVDEEEDFIGIGVVGLSLTEKTEPLIADLSAILRYEDYINNTFDEQLLFSLTANAEWQISSQRFHWVVRDSFEQLNIDALEPSTPDNTQNANAFSTGPDLFFHFGSSNRVELKARFEDTYFESSNADSRRYSAAARWVYNSLPTRDFFIRIDAQQVDFEDEVENENFTREDYTLGMDARFLRSKLHIEGGGTSIQRKRSDDFNGPLLRAIWNWTVSSLSSFELSASTQLTDAGRNFLTADTVIDQGVLQSEEITSDVFTEDKVQLSYKRDGHLILGGLGGVWSDQDYKLADLDRVIKLVYADIGYKFTPVLVGRVGIDYRYTKEFFTARVDKDSSFNVGFSYLIGRDLNVEANIGYSERNSNQPLSSFNEIRGLLGIKYRFDTIPGHSLFTDR